MDPLIMTEETVEIPLTPERIHPEDATTSRRNSTGRVSRGEKILPHYLRASTNSCHDFCKYGRHHAFEAKGKHPIPKKLTTVASKVQIPAKTVTLPEIKKKLMVKPKPLAEPKTQAPDKLKIVKREIKIVSREVSSPPKKLSIAARPENGSKPPLSPPKKPDVTPKPATGLKSKPVTTKSSSSPLSNSSGGLSRRRDGDIGIGSNTMSRRNSNIGIVNNTSSSKMGERKSLVPPTTSLSPKPSGNVVSSLSSRKPRVVKAVTPLKNENLVRKAEPKQPNDDKLKEKTLYIIEPKVEKKISSSSISGSRPASIKGNPSSRLLGVQGSPSASIKGSHSSRSPSIQGSRSTRSPSISGSRSSRTSSSLLYSSPSSSQSLSTDEGEEEPGYESTPSKKNGSASSKRREIKSGDQVTTSSKAKYRRTRTGIAHSEDKESAHKLNFRRGKVINPQDETNGSRRLRFKQGRVLDNQNGNGDVKRRSFRKRKEEGDKNGTKSKESEKVVLRHQDVQVTKDAQGLLNNVIEETASKLVETRKSKVKALVGAFETVISLQETKPAAASNNG